MHEVASAGQPAGLRKRHPMTAREMATASRTSGCVDGGLCRPGRRADCRQFGLHAMLALRPRQQGVQFVQCGVEGFAGKQAPVEHDLASVGHDIVGDPAGDACDAETRVADERMGLGSELAVALVEQGHRWPAARIALTPSSGRPECAALPSSRMSGRRHPL